MQSVDATADRVSVPVGEGRLTRTVRGLACALAFCLLTALFAQVRVPVPGTVVPMTLQSSAVLLTGYFLSAPLAVAAMLMYLAAGLAGAPVFVTGSLGLAGVTGGYIVGFVLGAAAVACLRGRSNGTARLVLAGVIGTAVIFLCGVLWQITFFGVSPADAWGGGVLPFLPKAAVQIAVAVAAVRLIGSSRRTDNRRV